MIETIVQSALMSTVEMIAFDSYNSNDQMAFDSEFCSSSSKVYALVKIFACNHHDFDHRLDLGFDRETDSSLELMQRVHKSGKLESG